MLYQNKLALHVNKREIKTIDNIILRFFHLLNLSLLKKQTKRYGLQRHITFQSKIVIT